MSQRESSSSQLEELWQRLDDPYEHASRESGSMPQKLITGLVALALGAGLAVSIGQLRNAAPGAESARSSLVEQIEEARAQADEQQVENLEIDRELARARADALGDDAGALEDEVERLEESAGTSELTGPGFTVTLNDRAGPRAGDPRAQQGSANRVQSQDLQTVVNGLFDAGATGVAINGNRLTSQSSIRGAGGAILVNYIPLTAPYEVTVVGPNSLRPTFLDSVANGYLQTLQSEYGVGSRVSGPSQITLPAAEFPSFDHVRPRSDSDRAPNGDQLR